MSESRQELIGVLEAVYSRAFRGGGHRAWCAKFTRLGVACTCGGDGLASVIMDLRTAEGMPGAAAMLAGQTPYMAGEWHALQALVAASVEPGEAGEVEMLASSVWRCQTGPECRSSGERVERALVWGERVEPEIPVCPECHAPMALVRVSR